jgi:hypothetical protein
MLSDPLKLALLLLLLLLLLLFVQDAAWHNL